MSSQVQWTLVPRSIDNAAEWRSQRSDLWRRRNVATTQYADVEAKWLADDFLKRLLGNAPSTMGVVSYDVCCNGDRVADCWIHVEPAGRTRRASLWELNADNWSGDGAVELLDELVRTAHSHRASGLEVRAYRGDGAMKYLVDTGELHRISSLMVRRFDGTTEPIESSVTVELVPMTSEQFEMNREHLIAEYASSLVRAGIFGEDEALADAKRQTVMMLPRGLSTPSHFWFVLRAGDQYIGTLWLFESRVNSSGHVYDVEVHPQYRGQGFGRAAMISAEKFFRARNARYLELHVFGYNDQARSLYESLGFVSVEESFIRDQA